MKKIIRVLMTFLIIYLIYAFVVSIIIYVFRNPRESEKITYLDMESERKNKDRAGLVESEKHGALIRINLIENAEESVDITYLTFRDSEVSRMILASVLDAANRGVQVRILLDSMSLLPAFTGEYRQILYGLDSHENIDLRFYDPINPLFPFTWNKRLHDKIIIVDNKLALMGGRNIADNYFRKDTKWLRFSKDRDALIYKDDSSGDYHSAIDDMVEYYNETWDYKFSKAFRKKVSRRNKEKMKIACKNLKDQYEMTKKIYKTELKKPNWKEYTTACEYVEFVHNPVGRFNHEPWCLKKVFALAEEAEESIFMQSPYFIPSRRIRGNFDQYDIDLEKAEILTNSSYSSPNHLSIAAYLNHRKKIVDSGVRINEYQGSNSLHGKTYVFDDHISILGSFNLDPRSSYINSESIVIIKNKEFTKTLNEAIQVDLDRSLVVGKDYSYIENSKTEEGEISQVKKLFLTIISKIVPLIEHML